MRNHIFTLLLFLVQFTSFSQSFEGWLTFKLEMKNPNPALIPDDQWQEGLKKQFGDKGYMVQKYFYKGENYISEIDAGKEKGYQALNTEDGLIYSWQENSDEAVTLDSKKYMDEFVEFLPSDKTETILDIECQSIILKSTIGEMTLYYHPEKFKVDPKHYEGHLYGHWEAIINKLGVLPIKIEQKGLMTHVVQTVIEYKETSIDQDKFEIPEFKTITKNPLN